MAKQSKAPPAAPKGKRYINGNYVFTGINTWLRHKVGFRTGNILSMIPKFFYNLSKEDRERTYEDLKARRAEPGNHRGSGGGGVIYARTLPAI